MYSIIITKIRANKIIARQGNMMKKKYNRAINTIEDELKI
jgi:hypothetical protein